MSDVGNKPSRSRKWPKKRYRHQHGRQNVNTACHNPSDSTANNANVASSHSGPRDSPSTSSSCSWVRAQTAPSRRQHVPCSNQSPDDYRRHRHHVNTRTEAWASPDVSGHNVHHNDSKPTCRQKQWSKKGKGQKCYQEGIILNGNSGNRARSGHHKGKSRWRRKAHNKPFEGATNSADSQAQCSRTSEMDCEASAEGDDELDIPGFYYDKEKKRYFKIAPNHSINSVTRDSIAKKKAEDQRQKDISSIMKGKPLVCQPTQKLKSPRVIKNLVKLMQDVSVHGKLTNQSLQTQLLTNTVKCLRPAGSQYLFNRELPGMYNNLEHMQMIRSGSQHDEILGLWSLKETWVQRIQMLHLEEKARTAECGAISVKAKPHHKVIIQSLNKVTDLCWAPTHGQEDKRNILYTTICHTGNLYSLAMIRSLNADDEQGPPTFLDYNLGKKATWTCAWNRHRQQFSVGSEKCALMLNVERRTMWEYNTRSSDPLSQVFSHQSGCYFHTGTRKGQILTYDLRSRSTYPVSTLQHKSSVCGLTLLQDDTHLLAADFSGKVCLWDLRKQSVVVDYHGNVNQYTKLPIHVDETEHIVYTVGEDGYTRFWTLQQGTPLHTIPPPCAVSRETIPVVQLSMRWGDRQGNAGLVMGLENKLYYYGALPLS